MGRQNEFVDFLYQHLLLPLEYQNDNWLNVFYTLKQMPKSRV